MSTLLSKSKQVRQTSFIYDHLCEFHNGEIPLLKIEILGKYPGDPGLRQATEAVSIRRSKPKMNGKKRMNCDQEQRHTRKYLEKVTQKGLFECIEVGDQF